MNWIKKIIFFSVLFFLAQNTYAQVKLDSLWGIWIDETNADTSRLEALRNYSWQGYLFSQPDSAFYFFNLGSEFAEKTGNTKYITGFTNAKGVSFYLRGDNDKALNYYKESLKISVGSNYKKGIASACQNLATVYINQSNFELAIQYNIQSLKIQEQLKDKKGIANIISNIAIIYMRQAEYEKALDYLFRSLKLKREIGNITSVSRELGNIGAAYMGLKDWENAIKYLSEALNVQEDLGDKHGLGNHMNNLAAVYIELEEYDKAEQYLAKCLNLREEIGDIIGLSSTLDHYGKIRILKGDYSSALPFSKKALKLAQQGKSKDNIQRSAESLYTIYKNLGKHQKALEMYELHIAFRDSIKSEENQKEVIRQEYKYAYEKEAATDSVAHMKEQEIKQAEIEKQKVQLKVKQNQQYALFGGITLVLIFSVFMYNRFKITQEQKVVIQEQKEEVETQRDQIENQKNKVELAHQEIKDSINYAKRIQNAILPLSSVIKENLPNSFVIYKPKDVVAGDFYWMETICHSEPVELSTNSGESSILRQAQNDNSLVYIASADCTGHGVPGAMVSVVCSNALTKAVLEDGITDVAKILDKTREIVISKLAKSSDVKDGMDISLACFDFENIKLEWAGANNPLYLLRNNAIEITKGDREAIGYTDNPTPFTKHTFNLQKGDTIYLFTDGYPDQFGGEQGKKMGYKNFRNKLIELSTLEMEEQNSELENYFENWKGSEEQVDDVCIISVRI